MARHCSSRARYVGMTERERDEGEEVDDVDDDDDK